MSVIFAIWIAFAALGASDDAPLTPVAAPIPLLQDLQRKMSTVRSVYLEFSQERHLKLFADPLNSEGILLVDKPDLIRWETTAPFQSILLADHKSVAQFENNGGEWKKLKLGFPQLLRRVLEQMALMNHGKMDALAADFQISVATNATVAMLTLVPKDQNVRAMMAALEVRMLPDFSTTREVDIREPGGDFTRIRFMREKRDVVFPAATFDQSKPADAAQIRHAAKDSP